MSRLQRLISPFPNSSLKKQNTACDACRSRKVRCHRVRQDKATRCSQHCLAKNYPCTSSQHLLFFSYYVQQAAIDRKRNPFINKRPRNIVHETPSGTASQDQSTATIPPLAPLLVRYGFHPAITLATPTRDVLSFVFAPPDNVGCVENTSPYCSDRPKSFYNAWDENIHKLEDSNFKAAFAQDLVEVFFQIVHTRIPLLIPVRFRSRLQLTSPTGETPLHPALVATVLAWGSKFSEHPLLVADRKCHDGRSLLAKTLVDRARDLAEALKVHRVPSSDHVIICLLIEPLQSQKPEDPNGFHGFWLRSAVRHLLDLQARISKINHRSVMANISDPESRGTMIFAWWMACICDAYASVYYRRKPTLDDDDYDIDFYTLEPPRLEPVDAQNPMPSPRVQLEGYYRAAHSLARTARKMSRHLWKPIVESDGIAYGILCTFSQELTQWRNDYLQLVGIQNGSVGDWDFVSAVSCCASDATYHVMWIILFTALDDFGLKESILGSPNANPTQFDLIKRKIADEALKGALRIAKLAGILTSNQYLKFDPAVMHVSCIQAGMFLARLGRPEVSNCIAGLQQYSASYDEAGDHAADMKRLYHQARLGDLELNHMALVTPRMHSAHNSANTPE
ncbi:hypothetical protein JOM56_015458 [Amanita muscaria]